MECRNCHHCGVVQTEAERLGKVAAQESRAALLTARAALEAIATVNRGVSQEMYTPEAAIAECIRRAREAIAAIDAAREGGK